MFGLLCFQELLAPVLIGLEPCLMLDSSYAWLVPAKLQRGKTSKV